MALRAWVGGRGGGGQRWRRGGGRGACSGSSGSGGGGGGGNACRVPRNARRLVLLQAVRLVAVLALSGGERTLAG